MTAITPKNITQQDIDWLIESLVVLHEIINKSDETALKQMKFKERTALKAYQKRLNKIYKHIDEGKR